MSPEMTRDEAVELVLIHATACSEVLFQGLLPSHVVDALSSRAQALTDKYGMDLPTHTITAFELLTATPPPVGSESDYENNLKETPNG